MGSRSRIPATERRRPGLLAQQYGPQLGGRVAQCERVGGLDVGADARTPRDGDGRQTGVARGDDVDGGIPHVRSLLDLRPQQLEPPQQRPRIGLVSRYVLVADQQRDVELAEPDRPLGRRAALGRDDARLHASGVQVAQQLGHALVPLHQPLRVRLVERRVGGVRLLAKLRPEGPPERVDQGLADPALDLGLVPLVADDLAERVLIAGHDEVDGVDEGAVEVEEDHGPAWRHGRERTERALPDPPWVRIPRRPPARASWWRRGITVFGDGEGPSMRVWTQYGMVVVVRIATLVWAVLQLPDKVATHFGPSGAADGWGTRAGYIAFDVIISAALVLGLPMLVTGIVAGSGVGLNIPHKEYWLRPENRPLLRRRLTGDMLFIGGATGLLLSWVDIEVVHANTLAPPPMNGPEGTAISRSAVAILGYTVWMATKRYAIPAAAAGR